MANEYVGKLYLRRKQENEQVWKLAVALPEGLGGAAFLSKVLWDRADSTRRIRDKLVKDDSNMSLHLTDEDVVKDMPSAWL